jgi:hypothetical protein
MKNKIILTLAAALGICASSNSEAQTLGQCTFVDVASLSAEFVKTESGTGAQVAVDATVLTKSMRWTRDKVYILGRNVIVPSGITLTIEPGTLIRAELPTKVQGTSTAEAALSPADPGALVVARGGRIIALGTAEAPIVMTTMDDPYVSGGQSTIPVYENYGIAAGAGIANPQRLLRSGATPVNGTTPGVGEYTVTGGTITGDAYDYNSTVSNTKSRWAVDGRWGGLVLAGYAETVVGYGSGVNALNTASVAPTINTGNGSAVGAVGIQMIEGMASFPTYGFGGGDNDNDDSGTIRFIDLRYGGYIIAAGKELNSYSLYGIGRNTVTEFLSDWNNADDSFEVWGGALNLRHCLSAFPGDDGLDTDQGWVGTVQFYVQLQNNAIDSSANTNLRSVVNVGDNAGENDGPEGSNSAFPYTVFTMANATFVGRGYSALSDKTKDSAGFGSYEAATGPCFKDNGSAKIYNSLYMDNPHGAMLIADVRAFSDTAATSSAGNSAINRFTVARTTGGFDGAGRASDLTTTGANATNPGETDGLFSNVWFYRNGLVDTAVPGVNGKYASAAAVIAASTVGNANYDPDYWKATDTNLFPAGTDRKERGANANATLACANIAAMRTSVKGMTGVYFDQNPGVTVPLNHHTSGIDLTPTAVGARDLPSSFIPTNLGTGTRALVNEATFVGAVRDSSWFLGWNNMANQAGVFANTAKVYIPDVTITVNASGNPLITFGGEAGVKYIIERSTDNKSFVKQSVVTAVAGNNPVTDSSVTVGATPIYYRVVAM